MKLTNINASLWQVHATMLTNDISTSLVDNDERNKLFMDHGATSLAGAVAAVYKRSSMQFTWEFALQLRHCLLHALQPHISPQTFSPATTLKRK